MATKSIMVTIVAAAVFATMLQAQSGPAKTKKDQTTAKATHTPSEAELIFARNCSRCHTAPQGFSPKIAGTVVMHMRVRAQLSQHDEQVLLRYFNP